MKELGHMLFQKKLPVKGRRKKSTKPKMSGKPRRALNAYNYFFGEQRQKILKERESMPHSERLSGAQMFAAMGKEVADRWKTLSDEKKKKYKDMADKDRSRYDLEMEHFNAKVERSQQGKPVTALKTTLERVWEENQEPVVVMPPSIQMPASQVASVPNASSLLTIARFLHAVLQPQQQASIPDRSQADAIISLLANNLDTSQSFERQHNAHLVRSLMNNNNIHAARSRELDHILQLVAAPSSSIAPLSTAPTHRLEAATDEDTLRSLGVQLWLANVASGQGLEMLRLLMNRR